jgi:hypothetical protein
MNLLSKLLGSDEAPAIATVATAVEFSESVAVSIGEDALATLLNAGFPIPAGALAAFIPQYNFKKRIPRAVVESLIAEGRVMVVGGKSVHALGGLTVTFVDNMYTPLHDLGGKTQWVPTGVVIIYIAGESGYYYSPLAVPKNAAKQYENIAKSYSQ